MALASPHPLSDDAFKAKLFQLLVDAEGLGRTQDGHLQTAGPFTPYYDSNGIMTFGVGLNLRVPANAYNVLLAFGLPPDAAATRDVENAIVALAKTPGPANEGISGVTQKILNGFLKQSVNGVATTYHDGSFTIADVAEAQRIFTFFPPGKADNSVYRRYLDQIPAAASMPDTQEQIALYSLTYNNAGALIPPGSHLVADIRAGNRAEAWYEIRYDSNAGAPRERYGVSLRRYAEAQLLDLYGAASDPAGDGQPSPSAVQLGDVLGAYRMFTAHRDAIVAYEQTWAGGIAAANQNYGNVTTVQTWAQAFDPAWQYLKATYGGDLAFQEHGAKPFDANDDESHVWAAPERHKGLYSVSIASPGTAIPAHYFVIGGDGEVVARSGTAPTRDAISINDGGPGNDTLQYAPAKGVKRDVTIEQLSPSSGNPDAPTSRLRVVSTSSGFTVTDLAYGFGKYQFATAADVVTLTTASAGAASTLSLSGSVQGTPFSDTTDTFSTAPGGVELLAGDGQSFTAGPNDAAVVLAGDGNTLTAPNSPGGVYAVAGSNDTITLPNTGAAALVAPLGGAGSTITVNADGDVLALLSSPSVVTMAEQNKAFTYLGIQSLHPIASQDEFDQAYYSGATIIPSNNLYGDIAAPSGGHSDLVLNGDGGGYFELVSGDAAITANTKGGFIEAEDPGAGPVDLTLNAGGWIVNPSDHSTINAKGDDDDFYSEGTSNNGQGTVVNAVGNNEGITIPGLVANVTGDHNVVIAEGYGQLNLSGHGDIAIIQPVDVAPASASPDSQGSTASGAAPPSQITMSGSGGSVSDAGSGNDTITTTGNGFSLIGGGGHDTLAANGDSNTLIAGNGGATLLASGSGNTLMGGSGNDVLRVLSGSGNTLAGGAGDNTLDGGSGSNAADYSAAPAGVVVDLGTGTARNGYGGTDMLIHIHSVIGSAYADTLIGMTGADTFDGHGAPAGTKDVEIGNGGDTFIFDQGYGQLEIDESDSAANPDNILRLGGGIDPAQVRVSSDATGAGVALSLGNGDRITLDGMQTGPGMGVQQVQFADGTVWAAAHVLSLLPSTVSLDGLAADQAVPTSSTLEPFAALTVADSNPQQQDDTATVTLSGTGETLSNLGTGQLSQDGLTYTASGSASVVQADLQGLLFAPSGDAVGGTTTIGLTLGNPSGSSANASVAVAVQADNSPAPMTFLYGAPGGSALAATARPDQFVFQGAAFGNEVVGGFDPARDIVELSRAQFTGFAAVQSDLSRSSSGALITLDGAGSILLQGVNPAGLQASNFCFV